MKLNSILLQSKKHKLYPVIIDSFEEYRYDPYPEGSLSHLLKVYKELRDLKRLMPDRWNNGMRCPSCPQVCL